MDHYPWVQPHSDDEEDQVEHTDNILTTLLYFFPVSPPGGQGEQEGEGAVHVRGQQDGDCGGRVGGR